MLTESLERRFDTAFNVTRTEQERNERLQQRIQQLEIEFSRLGEAFAMDDQIRSERDYFETLLLQHGIDPWALPNTDDSKRVKRDLLQEQRSLKKADARSSLTLPLRRERELTRSRC